MADPRLFISTDMQMITGVNNVDGDKDDVQSLVHALLYQDKFDIVGIASSTSAHQPGANDDRFIHHVIDEYAEDYSTLRARSAEFLSPDKLHDMVYQGTKSLAGSSGVPGATAASNAIIREAREAAADGEKLYVATWGGMGDVARALHDAPDIADDIRLITASGPAQEPNAYRYVKDEFAGEGELWWVDAQTTQRGIYADPDARLPPIPLSWAENNAKGHGNLGDFFYNNSKDVRGAGDNYDGVKMSDSWTVFYLIDGVNNDDPTAGSWGGSYRRVDDKYWADRTDQSFDWSGSNGAKTTYAHRDAWTGDFANRFDWLKGSSDDDDDDDNDGGAPAKPQPAPQPAPVRGDDDDGDAGGSGLVLRVSGDHYNGAPEFKVHVNGQYVGSYRVDAEHEDGEWDTVAVSGDFDAGDEVEVTFLNDLYDGSSDKDRNLWVASAALDGDTVGSPTKLRRTGEAVVWELGGDGGDDRDDGDNGDGDGDGPDTITVRASGDSWLGDPNFVISLNGNVISSDNLVSADHKSGEWQTFTFTGDFDEGGTQEHEVGIRFDNDVYGGERGLDRNLDIDQVTFNGQTNDMTVSFSSNGERFWDFDL